MRVKTLSRLLPDGKREIHGIDIINLPNCGKQKLSRRWLNTFRKFVSQDEQRIVIHTTRGDVVFNIDHGLVNNSQTRYCLTCNEVLPDARADPFADKCNAHVKEHGKSAETSPRWPHGYMVANSYECTIEDQRNG